MLLKFINLSRYAETFTLWYQSYLFNSRNPGKKFICMNTYLWKILYAPEQFPSDIAGATYQR